MPLPINIDELLNGRTVEWERIEYRKGWNPERTLKTICAFANDFNNWGGGYIIIGVEEKNGLPASSPAGLRLNQVDHIQRELNLICRRIHPNYFPVAEPLDYKNKTILILWCPGGTNRPYKAPDSLGEHPQYYYFIRRFSSTVKATRDEERELIGMANQIPFDDRINHSSGLKDLDLSTIKIFLNEIGSDLEKDIPSLSIKDIALRMNIAEGGSENTIPKNVGLLFFAREIEKFFPYVKIEFVMFKDESGTEYSEKIFSGPIHQQLKSALDFFKNSMIQEKILKQPGKAESLRFFNYPYEAFEEALCNAVYHRGYDNDSPIEVRIFPFRIEIISFPGPLPPLDKTKLREFRFEVRKYRNRRIGDFLKELHLTEGRSTGIPTILREMKKNGSPSPMFETDDERSYFKTSFSIHPDFYLTTGVGTKSGAKSGKANLVKLNKLGAFIPDLVRHLEQGADYVVDYVETQVEKDVFLKTLKALKICNLPQRRSAILTIFNRANNTRNYTNYIVVMLKYDLLEMTVPDKPKSQLQKYATTERGNKLLNILK